MKQVIPTGSGIITHALTRYTRAAAGAFANATERALASDTRIWATWCAEHGHTPLPAVPDAVAAFVRDVGVTKKPATIARYLASLAHLHRVADLPSPTGDNVVRLALRSLRRNKPTRQRQATGLNAAVLERLAVALTGSPRDLRDVAMLRLARDMLARRSELVALDITDLERADDGSATVIIRRSKTDQTGQGTVQFVSSATMKALDAYIAAAAVPSDGALFRSINKAGAAGGRLSDRSVSNAFKRLAAAAGLDAAAVSGHSARVGMCQDLTAAGAALPELMQAGRWKSNAMPARYSERQAAAQGAVARFYKA